MNGNKIINKILIFFIFFLGILFTVPASADTISKEGTIEVGENLKLSYFFGMSNSIGKNLTDTRIQVPNVNFIDNGKRVQHLFNDGHGQGNIIMGFGDGSLKAIPQSLVIESITGGGEQAALTATYTAMYDNKKFRVVSTITPRGNNVIVNDEITNISGKDLPNVSLGRAVDTALDGNDQVPVYYIGENTGLYISTGKYKLSYNFKMPRGPQAWKGLVYGSMNGQVLVPSSFPTIADTGQAELNAPADSISLNNADTAIAMKWDSVNIPNNGSINLGYVIGITPEGIEAPSVLVDQKDVLYNDGDLPLTGTVRSNDTSVDYMDLYYQVDDSAAEKFSRVENTPHSTNIPWELNIPEDKLNGDYPKQVIVYAVDSNGYYSDSATVDVQKEGKPVTIEYRNQNGKLLNTASFSGTYGQTYDISTDQEGNFLKEFDHYMIDPLPQNAVGTITDSPQTIVVTYTGEQVAETIGKVTVKYINQEGADLTPAIEATGDGLYGSPYTTDQKTFEHYDFVEVATDGAPATGLYTDSPQTVTYKYKGKDVSEDGKVTIEYRNQEGSLLDSTSFTGNYGQVYNISTDQDGSLLKEFDHYMIDPLPQNAVGTITDSPQTIVVTYTGEQVAETTGKVTVKYVNQEGTELTPAIKATGNGLYGSPYTTEEKTFENYDFVEVDTEGAPATGLYTDSPQTVTYKYKGQKVGDKGKVTVKYVNQEGADLTPAIEATGDGLYGSPYTTDQKTFEHYDFVEVATDGAPATGLYTDSPQTVTYKYKGQKVGDEGKVTIEYRNQEGSLLDSTSFTGNYGQVYNISTDQDGSLLKEFDHYMIDPLPQNAVGTITDSPQTIVVTYTGEQVAETTGKVTVKYVNQEGTELTPAIKATGNGLYGSPYTTEEKTFENYDFVEVDTEGAPATGLYTDSPQTVTYKYKGNKSGTVTVYYKNQAGDDLLNEPIVLTGEFGSNYQAERKEFTHYSSDDYPTNESGTFTTTNQVVTYTYTGDDMSGTGDVTVRYQTISGVIIFDTPPVIAGRYGDHFITELKTSLDYDFVRVTNNGEETKSPASGILTDKPQVILYSYQGKDAGKVSVNYVNQVGKLLKKEEVNGKIGEQTLIPLPVIPHYTIDPNQELTINFTHEAQAITITYTGEVAQAITEKHVGSDGHVFKEEVHEGRYGDAYEYNKLGTSDTVGYVYEKVTGAPNKGNFTDKAKTVTFMYKKNPVKKGKITVTYVDNSSEEKQIALPTTTTGTVGTSFEAKAKTIKGYTLDNEDTGIKELLYTEATQTVKFIYAKEAVEVKNVTVKFLDETGKTISGVNSVELSGNVGEAYDTTSNEDVEASLTAAQALGYRPEDVPKNAVGSFTTKNQTVIYVLKQGEVAGENVTISYREEGTTTPIVGVDDTVLTGTIGQEYYAEAVKIEGYEVVGTSTKRGIFTSSAQSLVFTYKKATGAPVTIRFVNEEGAEIKTSEQRTGLVGTMVWPEGLPAITDYTLNLTPEEEIYFGDLRYSTSVKDVTLRYRFNPTIPSIQAKVICIDLYGNILNTTAQVVQSGLEYRISAPYIPKYSVLGNGKSIKGTWITGEPAPTIYFTYKNK